MAEWLKDALGDMKALRKEQALLQSRLPDRRGRPPAALEGELRLRTKLLERIKHGKWPSEDEFLLLTKQTLRETADLDYEAQRRRRDEIVADGKVPTFHPVRKDHELHPVFGSVVQRSKWKTRFLEKMGLRVLKAKERPNREHSPEFIAAMVLKTWKSYDEMLRVIRSAVEHQWVASHARNPVFLRFSLDITFVSRHYRSTVSVISTKDKANDPRREDPAFRRGVRKKQDSVLTWVSDVYEKLPGAAVPSPMIIRASNIVVGATFLETKDALLGTFPHGKIFDGNLGEGTNKVDGLTFSEYMGKVFVPYLRRLKQTHLDDDIYTLLMYDQEPGLALRAGVKDTLDAMDCWISRLEAHATGAIQVNDTHLHGPLKRIARKKENTLADRSFYKEWQELNERVGSRQTFLQVGLPDLYQRRSVKQMARPLVALLRAGLPDLHPSWASIKSTAPEEKFSKAVAVAKEAEVVASSGQSDEKMKAVAPGTTRSIESGDAVEGVSLATRQPARGSGDVEPVASELQSLRGARNVSLPKRCARKAPVIRRPPLRARNRLGLKRVASVSYPAGGERVSVDEPPLPRARNATIAEPSAANPNSASGENASGTNRSSSRQRSSDDTESYASYSHGSDDESSSIQPPRRRARRVSAGRRPPPSVRRAPSVSRSNLSGSEKTPEVSRQSSGVQGGDDSGSYSSHSHSSHYKSSSRHISPER